MKKNYLKIIAIFLGIFLALFIVANFGINYWLKSQLPKYVKNNSHYLISYKTLDVDIATGNIHSTGISINNKNPQNQNVIGLQGTIDTLSISRLPIYFSKIPTLISFSQNLLMKKRANKEIPSLLRILKLTTGIFKFSGIPNKNFFQ
jgi:hypothetical protein